MTVREGIIISLETDDGAIGIAEASPLADFEDGVLSEVAAALTQMAPRVLGRAPAEAWADRLTADVPEPSQRVARAGIETALADLLARQANVPLFRWLAGQSGTNIDEPVAIPANALVDGSTPSAVTASVRAAVERGYRTVKLKVGAESESDPQRVAAARDAGPNLELRLDANGAWDDATAIAVLNACQPFRVGLCEQPLDPRREDVFEATATLRSQVRIPIALDESCRTPESVRAAVAAGAADAIVVKPMFTGLKDAIEMLRIARDAGLQTVVTTTFDTGVAVAMATHVAALLPAPRPACGLATLSRLEHPLILGNEFVDGPAMHPPGAAGLGVDRDDAALKRYDAGLSGWVAI
jgi:o-succinylbenzoate synthase